MLGYWCVGCLIWLPDVVHYSCLSYRDLSALSLSTQLQKLKRSLSFKTIMRSKSVENFFQRSFSDARMPLEFTTEPPPPSPPLLPGSPLVNNCSPSISPSVSPNPSISSHSPSLSLSPSLPAKPPNPQITHCFQDHVFRKPTNCQHCMNTIVGKKLLLMPVINLSVFWILGLVMKLKALSYFFTSADQHFSPPSNSSALLLQTGNSKQALRCKTCKIAAHLWCTSELSQQPCHGKVQIGFFFLLVFLLSFVFMSRQKTTFFAIWWRKAVRTMHPAEK